jgi:hypothetical protein
MPSEQFFSFVLDEYALFYSASLLKQEFVWFLWEIKDKNSRKASVQVQNQN